MGMPGNKLQGVTGWHEDDTFTCITGPVNIIRHEIEPRFKIMDDGEIAATAGNPSIHHRRAGTQQYPRWGYCCGTRDW